MGEVALVIMACVELAAAAVELQATTPAGTKQELGVVAVLLWGL
jgi:hypothetical protein